MNPIEIVYKSTDELIPYADNPRNNETAVDPVARSIQEFGFKVPIVLDADGVIVTGHTRLLAAKKLELEEVPCIIADDLTPEQVSAFRLADNRVSEFAEWDIELLAAELNDLDLDIDMKDFGFHFAEFEMPEEYFDSMPSPSLDDYEEPQHDMLRCPACSHVDRKEHFMKASGAE